MKPSVFNTVAVVVLGLVTTIPLISSANAETQVHDRFFCGIARNSATGEKVPATIARTARGNVPMILWKSTYFSNGRNDFGPQARCQMVSRRFQSYYRDGTLAYLTTGKVNAQNVICVADEYGGPCKGLLLTLEPNDDPQKVLQNLLSVRARASGPVVRGTGSTYIDVEEFLNTAPVQPDLLSVPPAPKSSPTK